MSIKIFLDEWFHHTPSLILNKWGKTPVHHLSILGIELGSLGCTTACPTTEPRLSLHCSLMIYTVILSAREKCSIPAYFIMYKKNRPWMFEVELVVAITTFSVISQLVVCRCSCHAVVTLCRFLKFYNCWVFWTLYINFCKNLCPFFFPNSSGDCYPPECERHHVRQASNAGGHLMSI